MGKLIVLLCFALLSMTLVMAGSLGIPCESNADCGKWIFTCQNGNCLPSNVGGGWGGGWGGPWGGWGNPWGGGWGGPWGGLWGSRGSADSEVEWESKDDSPNQ